MSMPRSASRSRSAGVGGAPPVATRTGRGSLPASGAQAVIVSTVGAAQKWRDAGLAQVPPYRARLEPWQAQMHAPAAVTAQGKHQPLQWNIGSVHR